MESISSIIGAMPRRRLQIVDSTIEDRTPMIVPQRLDEMKVCPTCKGAGFTRATVTFGHPLFGKPVPCVCKIQELKERQQEELVNVSGIMEWNKYQDASFEKFDRLQTGVGAAFKQARNFATNPDGWLVLAGPYGCGKTHLAVAIAKARLEAGDTVLMQTVPNLLDLLRSAYSPKSEDGYNETFEKMKEVDLLILDDFGAQNDTPWAVEKLFQLLNHRYNKNLATIITTNNVTLEGVDGRIKSRLKDSDLVTMVVMRDAKDYRGTKKG